MFVKCVLVQLQDNDVVRQRKKLVEIHSKKAKKDRYLELSIEITWTEIVQSSDVCQMYYKIICNFGTLGQLD